MTLIRGADSRSVPVAHRPLLRSALVVVAFAMASSCGSTSTSTSVSSTSPLSSTSSMAPGTVPPTTAPPTTEMPSGAVMFADWLAAQDDAGRTQGYTTVGDGTDARVVVAYSPSAPTDVDGGLLLGDGTVIDLPDGISTLRMPTPAGLGDRIVLLSPHDDGVALWVLDPVSRSWTKGTELGVFADPQFVPFVAVLDGRLVVASQTVRGNDVGFYVPDRFAGVIVDVDLSTEVMTAPPEGQFLAVTSKVGAHALMMGLDSAADANAPLTQPWDFDVRSNEWTAVPIPEWLSCGGGCDWMAPHEFDTPFLEAVVGDRVVKRLPDGSVGEYTPELATWRRLDDAPFELAGPAVAVLGNRVVVAPAVTPWLPNVAGEVAVLDVDTGSWSSTRLDVELTSADDYLVFEARVDGQVALLAAFTYATAEDTSPSFAFDATTSAWRAATPAEVAAWPALRRCPDDLHDLLR